MKCHTFGSEKERAYRIREMRPKPAALLVFQWVKTGIIRTREFYELAELIYEDPNV